jgi:hypothetical protein
VSPSLPHPASLILSQTNYNEFNMVNDAVNKKLRGSADFLRGCCEGREGLYIIPHGEREPAIYPAKAAGSAGEAPRWNRFQAQAPEVTGGAVSGHFVRKNVRFQQTMKLGQGVKAEPRRWNQETRTRNRTPGGAPTSKGCAGNAFHFSHQLSSIHSLLLYYLFILIVVNE